MYLTRFQNNDEFLYGGYGTGKECVLIEKGVLMYPIYDLKGINRCESKIKGKHVIILLFVKPEDDNADSILNKINYFHYKAESYCSIYLVGYSHDFLNQYSDVKVIKGTDGEEWQYSDKCFVSVCDELESRLKNWTYSGEPELIVLQNMGDDSINNNLDFRGYNYIDINYGIKKGYIDSFARFMERLLNACKREVESSNAIKRANRSRIKCRNVIEIAVENTPKLPESVKKVLKDRVFYKSFKMLQNDA
jgi:hypothetical protein